MRSLLGNKKKMQSPSSSTMDDAGPPSLFVAVRHFFMDPEYFSILQLDTPQLKLDTPKMKLIKKTEVVEKKHIIRFEEEPVGNIPRLEWLFSSPTSSAEDLYMVPNWVYNGGLKQLHGFKFNFTTGSVLAIKPPRPSKLHGHVVNLRGHIYFMGQDHLYPKNHSVFQCYDPVESSWKLLEPFPHDLDKLGPIVATAVCDADDTILFNVENRSFWAYDVGENKWYPVDVMDKRCFDIVGKAVVVEDTIYALTNKSFDSVLALSITKKRNDAGDLVFKCFVRSQILVPDLKPIDYKDQEAPDRKRGDKTWARTRHLVHLGKDNFCLVQSCNLNFGFNGFQNIQLTYIKLKAENANARIVVDVFHKVKLPSSEEQFEVRHCFSLPKCKTTALKEGKRFNLDLSPNKYGFQSEEDVKPDNDSSQWGQGLLIYVRLPPDATVGQLAMELQKFGPILTEWIEVKWDKEGQRYAFVQFESATSKQLAVEASPIMIGDCPTEILDKELTGITLFDCYSTQAVGSSSFGKNKFKNHEEDHVSLFKSRLEELEQEVMSLKSEVALLRSAIDSKEQKKQVLDPLKSEAALIKQAEVGEETELQSIWEENEELNVELASKGEPDYEKEKLKAERMKELASKGELDYGKEFQFRKGAEADTSRRLGPESVL